MPNIIRERTSQWTSSMPPLLRLLGGHLIAGVATGTSFAAALMSSNALGLRDLVAGTDQPAVAIGMLLAMNSLTFGSLAMGIGVMTLPLDAPDNRESGEGPPPADGPDR